jgi:hypothetical protein
MTPKKRSFVLTGLLVVVVGVALASGGLQIPKALRVFASIAPAPGQSDFEDRAGSRALPTAPSRIVSFQADRQEYSPGEVVILTGSGWEPGETVTLSVHEKPTLSPDRSWTVEADASGEIFDNRLIRDSKYIAYEVTATGQSSGFSRIIILATTVVGNDFKQCSNENPILDNCVWIGSNLQANNSSYAEGMATAQRILLTGLASGTHTMRIVISFTDSSKHSYDYLISWDQASQLAALFHSDSGLTFNKCADLSTANTTACNSVGNATLVTIPGDAFVSKDGSTQSRIDAFFATYGTRTLTIEGNAAFTGAAPNISPVTHTSDKAGTVGIANGADTGNTYAVYDVNWTSASSNILIEFAAHISKGTNTADGWGTGLGAGAIPGSPYHVIFGGIDGDGGGQDNQMQAGALEAPTPTPTATNTPTDTPTNTPTDTPTKTTTDNTTKTTTDTPTNTPTDTPTSTATNTPTNTPTATPTPSGQGCTPGFWKNHTDVWGCYTPNTSVSSVFTIPSCVSGTCIPGNLTLLQALSLPGGKSPCGAAQTLLRAGVAALLSACSLNNNYPLSTVQVIDEVNAALATCDRKTILAEATRLDTFNNLPCPLN